MSSRKAWYAIIVSFTAIFIYSAGILSAAWGEENEVNKSQPKIASEPFNNLVRKFALLAQDILAEKPKTDDATAEKSKSEDTSAKTPKPAEAKQTTQPATAKQLPTTSITSSSAQPTVTTNQPSNQTTNQAVTTLPTPEQKPAPQDTKQDSAESSLAEPKIEHDAPNVEELKLPPPSPPVTAKKPTDNRGAIVKFFTSGIDTNTPKKPAPIPILPRKTPKPVVIQESEPTPPKHTGPYPYERPESYKTQRLSDAVSKKAYTHDNEHLPKAMYNDEYKKILFESAATGNLDVLRAMVDEFQDTELLNEEGDTPLIYATMAGNIESILTLTSMDANVNAQNFYGVSSLYAATKLGRIDLVKLLLSRQAKPDLADKNGTTALMIACKMDFSTIAGMLLESGANLDAKMKNGDTAIHECVAGNSLASLNLLITKGADIEIRNYKGYTPLMLAVTSGKEQVAALLLNAGADISKKNANGQDVDALAKNSSNSSIAGLIESERIRRNLLAEKILATRSSQVITSDLTPTNIEPKADDVIAKRVNNIPLPIIKPLSKKLPKPSFSNSEMERMQEGS